MPCTVCTLLPVNNGWVAVCGATRQGPYLSKGIAFRIAEAEAVVLRRQGQAVKISIQDATGEVSAEYCFCDNLKCAGRSPLQ